jgi:DNA repair photolyase
MGTNTDPYQPIEREWRVTRSILQVMAEFKNPVGIVTKSALITRDIDILAPMAAAGLAKVAFRLPPSTASSRALWSRAGHAGAAARDIARAPRRRNSHHSE